MNKAKNVVEFYVLCNRLKDVVRTGWKVWQVKRERLESVAEHIYGVQMLAIAIWSEYQYEVDLEKVILMIAVHELEEINIGDLIPFEISKTDKEKLGHAAIEKILENLIAKPKVMELILEFDGGVTAEAKFASACDKLEAGLQCKLYDEEKCVDLTNQEGNSLLNNSEIQKHLQNEKSWSGAWLEYNKGKYNYDKNFAEISDYAKTHKIS